MRGREMMRVKEKVTIWDEENISSHIDCSTIQTPCPSEVKLGRYYGIPETKISLLKIPILALRS
jgi:hypothetical protein